MASRESRSQSKGGASSRRDKNKSPAAKTPSKGRKGSAGRPSADKPPGRKTAPRPVAVGRRKRPAAVPGRTTRLAVLLVSLCSFLLVLDLLLIWAPVSEHMDLGGYDRPGRVTGQLAHLSVGVPATQKAWRQLWLKAGYVEKESEQLSGPRQFSMTPGTWQVYPESGELLLITIKNRRVNQVIRAKDQLPVVGWDFPMPPLALLSDSVSPEAAAIQAIDLPPDLIKAIVEHHDPAFFSHHGLDLKGIAHTKLLELKTSDSPPTSPTLTRQVAHSMFTNEDSSWQRRGQELLISILLEQRYSKNEILEAWIKNSSFVAKDGTVQPGLLAAAQRHFGKDLAALNKSEVQLLAAGIAPFRASPAKLPQAQSDWTPATSKIPWLVDDLREQLRQRFPDETLHRDGLELRTTINPVLQEAARRTLLDGLAELRAKHPHWWHGEQNPQGALVAMDPRSGAIRALTSSISWQRDSPDPTTERLGTAGMAFKPIVLAAAIGASWPHLGPLSEVVDEPISIFGSGLGSTRNVDGTFLGRVSLRTATERSRQPPFVLLWMSVGPKRLAETARALGVQTRLQPRLSLSIGEQKVTLLDLCAAYATIANAGTRPKPRLLDGLRGPQGTWLERTMPDSQGAIDPRVASVVTTLLQGVIERGTAHRVRELGFRLPIAGSTGLSRDRGDAWMVGFTPDLVVALWIGTDHRLGLIGANEEVTVDAWTRFMLEAEPFLEGGSFRQPPGSELAGNDPEKQGVKGFRQKKLLEEDRERRREEQRALQQMEQGSL